MKQQIKVFRQEKSDGIADRIRASATVAYATKLAPIDPATPDGDTLVRAAASAEHPVETLFPMRDVLVTTGWNLNTDIFEPGETYQARYTPANHPLNYEHDEKRIIGHITTSRAVADPDFVPLPDEMAVDDLPTRFHLLNDSVIYRNWEDDEQQRLIAETIEEIKRGEWYVSMECIFRGFDYGVIGPDGTSRILARNEETAWLTKHLRQYGGSGLYTPRAGGPQFKLGRVLRHITFVGKGLVRQPANPASIIFNNVAAFAPTPADLGYITAEAGVTSNEPESVHMSEPNTEVKRLEDKVAELTRHNETLEAKVKEQTTAAIDTLQNKLKGSETTVAALQTEVGELKTAVANATRRAEDAESKLQTAETTLAELRKEQVKSNRRALLSKNQAPADKAEKFVADFANLSDEQFNQFVEAMAVAWKATPPPARKPEEVVNGVKPEQSTASLNAEETPEETAKANHQKVASHIGGILKFAKNK